MTRRDLSPGYQAVPSSHCMIDFILKYPTIAKEWHERSNYLAQLSVSTERDLYDLLEKAERKGIKVVPFYEPDLDGELTAITFEPTEASKKLCSSLPLMLKELNALV